MKKDQSKSPKGINIPWPIIFLMFIVGFWPIGILLIILREIPLKNSSNFASAEQINQQSTVFDNAEEVLSSTDRGKNTVGSAKNTSRKKKREKKSPMPTILRIIAVLLAIVGTAAGASFLSDVLAYGFEPYMIEGVLFAVYFLLGCGGCLIASSILRKREQDAARYAAVIGMRDSISLMKLCTVTSYKISRVRKDLQRMIDRGDFGDRAYIDMSNLCFMRTPDAVPDGVAEAMQENYRRSVHSTANDLGAAAASNLQGEYGDKTDTVDDAGDFVVILRRIRLLDDEIADESVSARICRIEAITRNIFEYVKDQPSKLDEIRMFMNYYLPTTLKLLESYKRIERVGVAGENMREAKDNIEKILDMLVVGFEQQFDQLFRAESLDISSDIDVLEQMMAKDGLTGKSDFVIRGEAFPDYSDDISDEFGSSSASAKM